MRIYTLNRYHRRRAEAILYLGGCCSRCGSTESLELDHIDSSTKAYDISKILGGGSKAKVQEELMKCQVLCHYCHVTKGKEVGDDGAVEHGGGVTGKRNCRCDLCGPLKSAYIREKQLKKETKERDRLSKNEDPS